MIGFWWTRGSETTAEFSALAQDLTFVRSHDLHASDDGLADTTYVCAIPGLLNDHSANKAVLE